MALLAFASMSLIFEFHQEKKGYKNNMIKVMCFPVMKL